MCSEKRIGSNSPLLDTAGADAGRNGVGPYGRDRKAHPEEVILAREAGRTSSR
jgi:hypothetical protein